MKKTRLLVLVVVVVLALVFYGTSVGYSAPVKDFDQPTGTTPSEDYTFTDTPGVQPAPMPGTPVVWWQVSFDFSITNLGIADTIGDFCPVLRVDSLTANIEVFASFDEGRIYQNQRLLFFNPPAPPSTRSWSVQVVVYLGLDKTPAFWNDTEIHRASTSVSEITGSSGRVLISEPGTYMADLKCVDTKDGRPYAYWTTTFVVESYWA